MKIVLLIISCFIIAGCATTTKVYDNTGEVWKVESASDAMVMVKDGDREITVDNRGKSSMLDKVIDITTLGMLKGAE